MKTARYLGMRPGDLEGKPYAKFWNPTMAPLSAHAREAMAHGPFAGPLLPPLRDAAALVEPGYLALEDGFALSEDGALHVAIRTEMPGTSPEMVDWWFGWHSAEPQRYKLWHPQSHVHAEWATADAPEARGRARYVGKVSHVDEYLGSALGSYAIAFCAPSAVGLPSGPFEDPTVATAVCARVGFADHPIDAGYLVHHVRRVAGGSEMRSRFWLGGPYAGGRAGSVVGAVAAAVGRPFVKPDLRDGEALLVHCAKEMAHLASFLPRIHAELHGSP
jgi:hypothetical protein